MSFFPKKIVKMLMVLFSSFFPFISSVVQSKLAIRAVLTDDTKLLKLLIEDVDRVCSVNKNNQIIFIACLINY